MYFKLLSCSHWLTVFSCSHLVFCCNLTFLQLWLYQNLMLNKPPVNFPFKKYLIFLKKYNQKHHCLHYFPLSLYSAETQHQDLAGIHLYCLQFSANFSKITLNFFCLFVKALLRDTTHKCVTVPRYTFSWCRHKFYQAPMLICTC